jgi:hypothetical protein
MRQPLGGRGEAGFVLDNVEFGDLIERRLGDGRLCGFPHIEYFSAAVAPTGDLGDRCCCRSPRLGLPRLVERGEPAVAIGLQEASEVGKMDGWMFAAAVGAIEVGRGWRCRAAERPVVADIHP